MVIRFLKNLVPVFSLFTLTSCAALGGLFSGGSSGGSSSAAAPAAGAATTSVPSIIDQVETSTKLAVFSPSAILDGNTSLEQTIVESQCKFRSADPPFLVPNPTANKNWTFNGRINEAEQKSQDLVSLDAQALEYRSWFGFGVSKQQLNTWPVSMVTLSEMPREYLEQRLAMLSDHVYQVNQRQQDALTSRYIEDSQKIQDRVQILVSSFDPSKCGSE
jgi:hypothetical protein